MSDLGLTPAQVANAETIIRIGRSRGMSERDIQTAIAVALAESNLQNYANSNVPESLNIPHDNVGSDHKSVGVFQQQVDIWGTAAELMDITTATNKFFDALEKVPTRSAMPIELAAQTVQRSAFSDGSNYAKHLTLAQQITGALKGLDVSASTLGNLSDANPIEWLRDTDNWKRIGLFIIGATILMFAVAKVMSGNKTVRLAASIASKGVVKP